MQLENIFENSSQFNLQKSFETFAGLGENTAIQVVEELKNYLSGSEQPTLVGAYEHIREQLERGHLVLTLEQLFSAGLVLCLSYVGSNRQLPAYIDVLINPEIPAHIASEQAKVRLESQLDYRRYVLTPQPGELKVNWIEAATERNIMQPELLQERFKLLEQILSVSLTRLPDSVEKLMRKKLEKNVLDYVYGYMMLHTRYYQDFVTELIADTSESTQAVDSGEMLLMFKNYTSIKISNQAYREMFTRLEHLLEMAQSATDRFPENPGPVLAQIYEMPEKRPVNPASATEAYWGAYYALAYVEKMRNNLFTEIATHGNPEVVTQNILDMWKLVALAHNRKETLIFRNENIKPYLIETMRLLARAQMARNTAVAAQLLIDAVNVFGGFFYTYTAKKDNDQIFNKSAYRRIHAYLKRFSDKILPELSEVIGAIEAGEGDDEEASEDGEDAKVSSITPKVATEEELKSQVAPAESRPFLPNISRFGDVPDEVPLKHIDHYQWLEYFQKLPEGLPVYSDPTLAIYNPHLVARRLTQYALPFLFETQLEHGFYRPQGDQWIQADFNLIMHEYRNFVANLDERIQEVGAEANRCKLAIRQPDGTLVYKINRAKMAFRTDELWQPRQTLGQQFTSKIITIENHWGRKSEPEGKLFQPGFYVNAYARAGLIVHPHTPNSLIQLNIPVALGDDIWVEKHSGAKLVTVIVEPVFLVDTANIVSIISRVERFPDYHLYSQFQYNLSNSGKITKLLSTWSHSDSVYLLPRSTIPKISKQIGHEDFVSSDLSFETFKQVYERVNVPYDSNGSKD